MKPRLALFACSLALAGCGTGGAVYPRHAILTGAIVNVTKQAGSVTENPIEPAATVGDSCAHSFAIPVIWLSFAFMNASGKKAATGIERIAAIDRSNMGILGVYANSCAEVTPGGHAAATVVSEPAPAVVPSESASSTSPAPPAADQRPVTAGAPAAWPASVPISERSTCSLVCVAKEGAAPREADRSALEKGINKHLGALRACIGGGKSAAGVVVSFDSRGNGIVNYDFGPRTTPRADCPGSFPPVKNVSGPKNATWKCTDYCE